MNSAAAAFTWACWASISGGIASRRMFAEATTSRRTLSGYFTAVVQRHPATERVADDVRLVQPEVVDERGDVVGHQPDVDRSIDVGGAAVALQVDGDDLVALRERGKNRPEHLARPEPAVQQDQRPPGPDRLVVEIDAVDLGVLAGALGLGRPIGGGHDALLSCSLVAGLIKTPRSAWTHRPAMSGRHNPLG